MSHQPHVEGPTALGRVVTFYSYKGGVGRSMLLSNVGALLARWSYRVLLIDFDLEAPGLDQFFRPFAGTDLRSTPGVVDMLHSVAQNNVSDWRKYVTKVALPEGRALDLMHAGRGDAEYAATLAGLNWETMFSVRGLGRFLENWRNEMIGVYDFVLVDSRTGITDIGGICTIHLPDVIVGLVTTTHQSLTGLREALDGATAGHSRFPTERERLAILPVASRDESANAYQKATEWRRRFADELGHLLWWRPRETTAESIFDWLRIPYETHWSFGEQLPVLSEDVENPKNLSFSYFQVAQLLLKGFDWSVVRSRASSETEAVARREEELRAAYEKHTKLLATQAAQKSLKYLGAGVLVALMLAGGVFTFVNSRSTARLEAEQQRALREAKAAELALEREREEARKVKDANDKALLAYGEGHAFIAARNYEKAIEAFDTAIALNPNNPDFFRSRAVARDGLARISTSRTERAALHSAALEDFVKWVDLAPTPSRRLQVAESAVTNERPDLAVDQARKLTIELQKQPNPQVAKRMIQTMDSVVRIGGKSPVAADARSVAESLRKQQ